MRGTETLARSPVWRSMLTTIIVSVRRPHRFGPASPPSRAMFHRPGARGGVVGTVVGIVVGRVVAAAVVATVVDAGATVTSTMEVGTTVVVMPRSASGLG